MILALIDGDNAVRRCSEAMKDKHTPERIAQSADDILRDFTIAVRATHCVVAFDSHPTFRHELYWAYKASRTRDPIHISAARACFEKPTSWRPARLCIDVPRYEADDIVATLAHRVAGRAEIEVLSSDSDLLVLTALPACTVYRYGRKAAKEPYFVPQWRENVVDRLGVTPEKLGDLKAIVGEPTDELPGLPKHGIVSAQRLLAGDGSLERACALNPKYAWQMRLVRQLVLPATDAPVPQLFPSACSLRAA